MLLTNHISSVIKSCFMRLHVFHHIHLLISKTAAITLANSFIHSRLFYGLPNCLIHCLQKVQNTIARIVTRSICLSHIALILKSLHWLPENYPY